VSSRLAPISRELTCFALQTSLFISPLPASTTEQSLRTHLLSSIPSIPPTAVKSIVYVEKNKYVYSLPANIHMNATISNASLFALRRCAFINFKDRFNAERAVEAWATGVAVDEGARANVRWGRSRPSSSASAATSSSPSTSTPVPAAPVSAS